MDDDGENIEQIIFNQSYDLDFLVMDNGIIVFSWWDNVGQICNNGVNFYQVNFDGIGLSYFYGWYFYDLVFDVSDVQYFNLRNIDIGVLLVQFCFFESIDYVLVLVEVLVGEYVEVDLCVDGSIGFGQCMLVDGVGFDGEFFL